MGQKNTWHFFFIKAQCLLIVGNSSLDKLGKNLSDKYFKYLIEEFGIENLELLKQKVAYSYEYMNSFEPFNEEKLPVRKYFEALQKIEKLMMMVKCQMAT